MESYEDVIASAPQVARPVLMAAVKEWDERSIRLNNNNIITWNGVIIEMSEGTDDSSKWLVLEPHRRLDGTIVYGDSWERRNSGEFIGPSGIMIDAQLCLVHRNGVYIFPNGLNVQPSGQEGWGPPKQVGIIYRPGSSPINGIQHFPMPEEADAKYIDQHVKESVGPADFSNAPRKSL